MTTRTYGGAPPLPPILERQLRLVFRTEHLPLRWSHCSSTANFLSSYYTCLFRAEYTAAATRDLAHSIAYLANELLENAVKFRAPGDVEVSAGLEGEDFLLRTENQITAGTAARFEPLLAELTAGDPGELLLARIEANAADDKAGGSGLGLLTLMNDYGVRFCWTFAPTASHDGRVRLETIARLRLPTRNA